jgi:hypothetical protein
LNYRQNGKQLWALKINFKFGGQQAAADVLCAPLVLAGSFAKLLLRIRNQYVVICAGLWKHAQEARLFLDALAEGAAANSCYQSDSVTSSR